MSQTRSKVFQARFQGSKSLRHDQKIISDVAKPHLAPKQYITKSFANDNI